MNQVTKPWELIVNLESLLFIVFALVFGQLVLFDLSSLWFCLLLYDSNLNIADKPRLIQPQQHLLTKQHINTFMLNMSIGQNIIIIPNQQPPQHLPINLILQFFILRLWVQSE